MAIGRQLHTEACEFKAGTDHIANCRLVIDNENIATAHKGPRFYGKFPMLIVTVLLSTVHSKFNHWGRRLRLLKCRVLADPAVLLL
jgi:hypothetical protein